MTTLYVGTDPEVMLVDVNGSLKSAIGIVKGTKEEKIDLGHGNLLFHDNVLAEVNIPPGSTSENLVNNIRLCLSSLTRAVKPYQIRAQASATYPKPECQHPDAQVFGCEAEFCAYALGIVQAPECTTTFRSAGGHIHLGYKDKQYPLLSEDPNDRDWGRVWVVRMMDLFLGIPSLWLDQDPTSPARRKLYGKAGTHRPKEEYGVEYRATSNFWIKSPTLVRLIYNISKFVVDFVGEKKHLQLWKDEETCKAYKAEDLCAAINTSNKNAAKVYLNGLVKEYMPEKLFNEILAASEPVQYDIYKEWALQ